MSDAYRKWYEDFEALTQLCEEDELFASLSTLLHRSRNTFALNRKLMQKAIDVSWVEAIENGLLHLDNCLRTPRRTIEDVEEIVPIALSRKITVESVKHLAQHTDLIQSVDKKSGKITPSKILNVHKEESLMTYENKFLNTLVNRLFIFINTRYEKLAQITRDEQAYTLHYDTALDDGAGGRMKMEVKLETISSLDSYDDSGYTVWQRVEKLKKAIEGYMGSELCQALGTTYIRPPVMRTNAIMKNVDLKACLALWQYIESYDKAGYEIRIEDTAVQPEGNYVEDFYRVVLLHMLLFRSQMEGEESVTKLRELKTQKGKVIAPKFLKRFEKELSSDYGIAAEGVAGYIAAEGAAPFVRRMPENVGEVFDQIGQCIAIEQAYRAEEAARLEAQRAAEEEEARREEERRRIEAARQAELERIEAERAEEARRLEEMLAKKRAEQEAAMRERERQEQERLALLEEKRKREEEERLAREEAERIEAERRRIAEEKQLVRSELGEALGMDEDALTEQEAPAEEITVTEEEVEEAIASMGEQPESEFEDPREVAARMKREQQQRERERAERERAERLKAERQYFESKPFREIYKEYSWNPFYAIPRLIRLLLAVLFGIIPEDTDNPDLKQRLAAIKEKKRLAAEEKSTRQQMEVYYRKYAPVFPYKQRRWFEDQKFKRKRAKEQKGKPRPAYHPPQRTPEEELAIRTEMQRLYREYHVSVWERIRRRIDEFQANRKVV